MIMKKNILVVDDSALMRRVICDIINSDDTFQVTDVCRDGLEAYEKLKVNRYDGVILDVNMPRMGGLELLECLQKERIKTNVIMVSTMTTRDADVTILAMERGAVDFVTKPTNIIGLNIIYQVLVRYGSLRLVTQNIFCCKDEFIAGLKLYLAVLEISHTDLRALCIKNGGNRKSELFPELNNSFFICLVLFMGAMREVKSRRIHSGQH